MAPQMNLGPVQEDCRIRRKTRRVRGGLARSVQYASFMFILVSLSHGLTACGEAKDASGIFSFESYEGDGSAPRIEDAKTKLEEIVPMGSAMTKYNEFFESQGGKCGDVVDVVRFPNTITCSYKHGFFITSEWKYTVTYDPLTMKSRYASLSFGLTGM